MKISIITPSFNQGIYIEDAINSVLLQNYADFEHIVVDGASTDDTLIRLKKYPHLKWVSEKDTGQSDALNKGFKMATGDIIGWLNCDDFYLAGAFDKVTKAFVEASVIGVYSDLQFCDENRNITQYYHSNRPSKFLSLFHTYIPSETLFFKRIILDKISGVNEAMHYCMDQEFIARILYNNYELKYVNSCFAVFRWQGMNKSLDTKENRKKRIEESIIVWNTLGNYIILDPQNRFHQFVYTQVRNLLKFYRYYLVKTS
jgi:glycosyltransferase involved in cell wall biosynthesis